MWSRVRLIGAVLAVIALGAAGAAAADRPAYVIVPTGSPLRLDQSRATLFDTPALSVSVENRHTAPVTFTLRIWIFDPQNRLKGAMDYCVAEPLDRSSRGQSFVPLSVHGITARDRGVVTIAAAQSDARSWQLAESTTDQIEAARAEAQRYSPTLTLAAGTPAAPDAPRCPCVCAAVVSWCDQTCSRTRADAFTCSPSSAAGCEAGCSCR